MPSRPQPTPLPLFPGLCVHLSTLCLLQEEEWRRQSSHPERLVSSPFSLDLSKTKQQLYPWGPLPAAGFFGKREDEQWCQGVVGRRGASVSLTALFPRPLLIYLGPGP